MKHSILFTAALALLFLFSCEQKTINTTNHADGIDFNERNWQEIDDWYINYFKGTEVTQHDVHLKIKAISSLLYQEDSKFSREASKEKKLFYGQDFTLPEKQRSRSIGK